MLRQVAYCAQLVVLATLLLECLRLTVDAGWGQPYFRLFVEASPTLFASPVTLEAIFSVPFVMPMTLSELFEELL